MSRLNRPSAATEAALKAVARGMSIAAAARKHGLAASTVSRARKRAGLPGLTAGRTAVTTD